jgi:hypothetical protein
VTLVESSLRARGRGRAGLLIVVALAAAVLAYVVAGSLGSSAVQRGGVPSARAAATGIAAQPATLVVRAPRRPRRAWQVIATVGGTPAAWLSSEGGATMVRFDQKLVRLDLHAGKHDGGTKGWRYGDKIAPSESARLIAAFNGGFKLTYKDTGFMANGHVAVPLKPGLASLVTYSNGRSDIGAWQRGFPSGTSPVFSVLQNQYLLVDHGVPATNLSSCVIECWGGTVHLATAVARSALGITSDGQLVWAAGEQLSPAELARALIGAGAQRAIELDINPWWVAGYVYLHRTGRPKPVPLIPRQRGIEGALLEPYSRDFLAFVGV